MEMKLAEKLNKAYGLSTKSNNLFEKVVKSIKWDQIFTADGETYYCKGDLGLTVENLDPFKEKYRPSIMIGTLFFDLGYKGYNNPFGLV